MAVPWIGITDARRTMAGRSSTTRRDGERIAVLGVSPPSGDRMPVADASVGYVVVMGVPMSTSQDFVNWVCETRPRHRAT